MDTTHSHFLATGHRWYEDTMRGVPVELADRTPGPDDEFLGFLKCLACGAVTRYVGEPTEPPCWATRGDRATGLTRDVLIGYVEPPSDRDLDRAHVAGGFGVPLE